MMRIRCLAHGPQSAVLQYLAAADSAYMGPCVQAAAAELDGTEAAGGYLKVDLNLGGGGGRGGGRGGRGDRGGGRGFGGRGFDGGRGGGRGGRGGGRDFGGACVRVRVRVG